MVADGLVIGSSGNISMRVDKHHFVVTAGGVTYDKLTPADHQSSMGATDRGTVRANPRASWRCTEV